MFFSSLTEIKENLYERYSALLMEKFSPLTPNVNKLLSMLKAGGMILHFWNDPLYLEQTMSLETFTYYDNSRDKLTFETFFLIFVFLACGMALSLIALIVEKLVHRFKARKAAKLGRRPKRMFPRGPEKRRNFYNKH